MEKKRILLTGASGFVGHRLMEMEHTMIAAPSLRDKTEGDIRRIVEESGAEAIIHTAAISDIGTCEKDPDASYHANVELPLYLARAAGERKLIAFSSDQVYGGCKEEGPYREDMVCPANTYAGQKLEMEQRVLEILPDAVMLRAEWMYDHYLKRPNYLMNILNAGDEVMFSSNQYRGITYLKEVLENMEQVLNLPGGAYNFGSMTTKSMYEITQKFLQFLGKDIRLSDAPARHNLWMDCTKAGKYGVQFSSVEDGLKRCAEDYGLVKK